jgi:hypothetical protein
MEALNQFFTQHGSKVITGLLFLILLKTCSVSSNLNDLEEEVAKQLEVSRIEMQIEGLKAEDRMIQAADRRIFDLKRQAAIREEVDALLLKRDETLNPKRIVPISEPKEK